MNDTMPTADLERAVEAATERLARARADHARDAEAARQTEIERLRRQLAEADAALASVEAAASETLAQLVTAGRALYDRYHDAAGRRLDCLHQLAGLGEGRTPGTTPLAFAVWAYERLRAFDQIDHRAWDHRPHWAR